MPSSLKEYTPLITHSIQYMRQNIKIYILAWVGYMATKVTKNSPAKIRMRKQFTSYLLPFLMNTNTFEIT